MIELLQNFISVHDMTQPDGVDLGYLNNFHFHFYWMDRQGKTMGCNKRVLDDLGFKNHTDYIGITADDLPTLTGCPSETALMIKENNSEVMEKRKDLFFIEPAKLPSGITITGFSHKAPLRARYSKNYRSCRTLYDCKWIGHSFLSSHTVT
jgi:uncharacterized protein YcfL